MLSWEGLRRSGVLHVSMQEENLNRGALTQTLRYSSSPPVQDGCTPVYIASQYGHLETVKALIESRANVDAKLIVSLTYLYADTPLSHTRST